MTWGDPATCCPRRAPVPRLTHMARRRRPPNDTRVRSAGPARKPIVRPKACEAPGEGQVVGRARQPRVRRPGAAEGLNPRRRTPGSTAPNCTGASDCPVTQPSVPLQCLVWPVQAAQELRGIARLRKPSDEHRDKPQVIKARLRVILYRVFMPPRVANSQNPTGEKKLIALLLILLRHG